MSIVLKRGGQIFAKQDTYTLRGLCMLAIIIHHVWMYSSLNDFFHGGTTMSLIFKYFGFLGTGVFFMISGFGMFHSLTHKAIDFNYIISKIVKLLIPFIVSWFVYIILFLLIDASFSWDLLGDFFTFALPNNETWFLRVIIALYVVSIIAFKTSRSFLKPIIYVFLSSLIFIGIARYFKLGVWWYNTILNFPIGMLFAFFYKNISEWKIKQWAVVVVLLSLGTGIICLFDKYIAQIGVSLVFSIIAILSVKDIKIKSSILSFIGAESLFFYLLQNICFGNMANTKYGFILFLLSSLLLVYILTKICSYYSVFLSDRIIEKYHKNNIEG